MQLWQAAATDAEVTQEATDRQQLAPTARAAKGALNYPLYPKLWMDHPSKIPDPSNDYWPGGADETVATLENGVKVKTRMLRMRACTEKDAKGKMCRGHLKRWFDLTEELKKMVGSKAEVYRCERCHTVYLPNAAEQPRTQTLAW